MKPGLRTNVKEPGRRGFVRRYLSKGAMRLLGADRKSTRLNSSHLVNSYAVFCLKKKSSAPVLQTPKATSSTLYFDSLTVNAGYCGFLLCIQMDTSVNAATQVVFVGADIAFDADPKFFACLVRFESSSVPTTLSTVYDFYFFFF